MRQHMKNKPIKWGFKFWFRCGAKSGKCPALLVKLLEKAIYVTGTVTANRRNMPVLKHHKEMKCGQHDWFSSNHLSAIKWMDNKSVILLSNYLNPK